jgi:hypothetical protein
MPLVVDAPDGSSQGVILLAPCIADTWRVRGSPFHDTMRRAGGIDLHEATVDTLPAGGADLE